MSKFFCGLFLGLLVCKPVSGCCEIISRACVAAIERIEREEAEAAEKSEKSEPSVKLAE